MLAPWKVAPGSRVVVFMLAQCDAPVEGSPTGASRAAEEEVAVEERVEPQLEPAHPELIVDVGALENLDRRALPVLVVDDLDPLALLHVVGDQLADHAVGEGVVRGLDREVLEEVRGPEALEVVEHPPFGLVGIRHPDPVARPARLGLDVIEIGLRFDERFVHRVKPELDGPDDGVRAFGGQTNRCSGLAGGGRLRRRLRSVGRSRLRCRGVGPVARDVLGSGRDGLNGAQRQRGDQNSHVHTCRGAFTRPQGPAVALPVPAG